MKSVTPMLSQYLETKAKYQDCILFFRLGDFYEMFFDDAIVASKALEITLTKKRVGGGNEPAPLCGVPYHSAESYIAKLISKGHKVAICEQTEDPKLTKSLVKRDVIRVITPGTVNMDTMLSGGENSFLCSIFESEDEIGLAWCDISTGELYCSVIAGPDRFSSLEAQLSRIAPNEILLNEGGLSGRMINENNSAALNIIPNAGNEGGKCDENALNELTSYLNKTTMGDLSHMRPAVNVELSDGMMLDRASIRNLELCETLFERDVKGSLLSVLDKTHTAMGSRLMKKWLKEPLISVEDIKLRLDAVQALYDDRLARNNIKTLLKLVYDLERLSGRVSFGNANARDLIALLRSAEALPQIKSELAQVDADEVSKSLLNRLNASVSELTDIRELIDTAVVDDPPFTIREGGIIRSGYSQALDDMKYSIKDGQEWIASLESKERERTGIKNLKVGYNKVFGYYIDITNPNKDLVPENYIRKQTLVSSERYITPEMKEVESVVLGAEARINELEYEIFTELRTTIQGFVREIQQTSEALATLDVLCSFAEVSEKYGYTNPEVDDGDVIQIERGRHPVIERFITETTFVPNDVYIDRGKSSMLLITGPNMAGKSTYMRQCALIVLMAQVGCFIPADSARIGICDRIYTRIGASDNLSKGESTYYVEMKELAYILNTATPRSLIILDEIGRGTSTYDGLAIAWAVIDSICGCADDRDSQIRCLFATHYHELTTLEGTIPGLINLNTEIAETNGEIVFLHRISEGSSSRSYGIHVAKLAGVPKSVLDDAEEKLLMLESERGNVPKTKDGMGSLNNSDDKTSAAQEAHDATRKDPQLSIFSRAPDPVVIKLRELDLMSITPSQAFEILEEIKKVTTDE